MTTSMEIMAREQLRAILPDALSLAFNSYKGLVHEELSRDKDTKTTSSEQNTKRAVLAHISSLLKLCEWADSKTKGTENTIVDTTQARENYQKFLDEYGDDPL